MSLHYDSKLKRLMLMMNQAFDQCSQKIDPLVIERMAEVIYQVMSARYRIFHTMEHIFTASEGSSGASTFAALFHDIVYYQVDKRIHPLLMPHQAEFVLNEKTNECTLPDLSSERWLSIAGKIFGFKTGQVLNPFNGLNEFLSSVAAARMLSPAVNPPLSDWQTIQVIACIEATIPFRSQAEPDKNSYQLLRQRLGDLKNELKFKIDDKELDQAVRAAVGVANQDICSFYSDDLGDFVSGTWNLILENNPIFKNPLYTVIDYRKALQKVRGFFMFLKPENVVHEWGGLPAAKDYQTMKQQVSTNLANAIHYLDFKLVEITILEVLATSSGGDAPYFLFIGEADPETGKAPIEQYFPAHQTIDDAPKKNAAVYQVLRYGRKGESLFDFNHSPIGAFLYESLTDEEINLSIVSAQQFHEGKMDGKQFIASIRKEVIQLIANAVSEISWSRKTKLT